MHNHSIWLVVVCSCAVAGVPSRATDVPSDGATRATSRDPTRVSYGFVTDFTCQTEQMARSRIDTMVDEFGIHDVQFYDWFADYSTPTSGTSWTDPWFHEREICAQTIRWYIDELHQRGARAWAYVQSIASQDAGLADSANAIYPLLDATGKPFLMGGDIPTYFANASWARHQVTVWGQAVAGLGFDGIHWDTLGPIAGDYAAETAGFQEFLRTASPLLAALGLKENLNFVNLSWWDDSLLDVVAFPYVEVWTLAVEQDLYVAMGRPAMAARSGVMAFYPSVLIPDGWTQSQVMLARHSAARDHALSYLVIGDGAERLVNEYFPSDVPLTQDEIAALAVP